MQYIRGGHSWVASGVSSRFFQARVGRRMHQGTRANLAHRRLTPDFTFIFGGGMNCVSCDICVYHLWLVCAFSNNGNNTTLPQQYLNNTSTTTIPQQQYPNSNTSTTIQQQQQQQYNNNTSTTIVYLNNTSTTIHQQYNNTRTTTIQQHNTKTRTTTNQQNNNNTTTMRFGSSACSLGASAIDRIDPRLVARGWLQ